MRDDNDLFVFANKSTLDRKFLCHSGRAPFYSILGEHAGPPLNEWWEVASVYEKALIQADNISLDEIDSAPRESGVYVLFYENRFVYVGCTDDLKSRLKQHAFKLESAKLILTENAFFRFVRVDQCGMLCVERCLIKDYGPEWNRTGFGRRPGKSLDLQRLSEWDRLYEYAPKIGGVREETDAEENIPMIGDEFE